MEHRVLVVEDDAATAEHLRRAVEAEPSLALAGIAGTLADGIAALRREAPGVLLVDLGLPDGSGIELIQEARRLSADTLTMVITVFGDEKSVVGAIEAGARGYLLKDGTHEQIAEAILQLVGGGSPISPRIARHLLRRFQDDEAPAPRDDVPSLSAREREVLGLIVKGFTFAEAAGLLGISAHTVTSHVRHIYRKLEVSSRSQAVYEAVSLGIVRIYE